MELYPVGSDGHLYIFFSSLTIKTMVTSKIHIGICIALALRCETAASAAADHLADYTCSSGRRCVALHRKIMNLTTKVKGIHAIPMSADHDACGEVVKDCLDRTFKSAL
jgi:hypothetical protein